MFASQISAFFLYILMISSIAFISVRRATSTSGFILGNRQLNYWITAISANASDMSVWLFMGLPMAVYSSGLIHIWTAVGLIFFMFLNWHFIAPKLRVATEESNSLTLFSFFEKRLGGQARAVRAVGAIFSTVFLTIYVAAGITGMGYLFESVFGLNYTFGCVLSVAAILGYISVGGFMAICYADFAQGMFLLLVICMVPVLVFFGPVQHAENSQALSIALAQPILSFDMASIFSAATLVIGWGVGYFGQPHILNKFMAIKNVDDLTKSKWIGTAWQVLALSGAVASGLAATYFFSSPPANLELIFVDMVKAMFNPFFAAFVLCAILAATLSTVDSQVLVVASIIAEDFYHALTEQKATDKKTLLVSRLAAISVCAIALLIALSKNSSIFDMVYYCWVGIGSAFGPLVIASLYFKNLTKEAALAGMVVGGGVAATWTVFGLDISAAVPGFIASILIIWLMSNAARLRRAFKMSS